MTTSHPSRNDLTLPESGGANVFGNPVWVAKSAGGPARSSVIEADRHSSDGTTLGAVRIHQLFGTTADGLPHGPEEVEALGLALIAAARAVRAGS